MTALDTTTVRQTAGPASAWRAFTAILWQDTLVTGKEFWVLLIQVALTPLFMLFIFAKVLSQANYVNDTGTCYCPASWRCPHSSPRCRASRSRW